MRSTVRAIMSPQRAAHLARFRQTVMTADVALKKLIADVVALVPRASARPPATARELAAVQRALGVSLPEDVVEFYSVCDGFDEPTDLDHGWIQLWRLADWQSISKVCSAAPRSTPEPIVIADHSLNCWWYALDLGQSIEGRIPIVLVDGMREPYPVFESFSGFLRAILEDDAFLYGGPAA
jgi:hypothetical protein